MSTSQVAHEGAPRRYTSATLTGGVLVAAVLFAVALMAEVLGAASEPGEMTDIAAVLDGLVALDPWAWATAGAYAIVLTPAVGLLVTIGEYSSVSERRTALLALAVLAILTISAAIAITLPSRWFG